jgi:hypothetical protein
MVGLDVSADGQRLAIQNWEAALQRNAGKIN